MVPLCPPIRLYHHSPPYEAQPWRERMRGKWPVTYEDMAGYDSQEKITLAVIAEVEMIPPAICSCCGRELAGDLPRQYEIGGTWDNFGPESIREPCSPRYLSICRQPWGVPDWEM